jgi:crossover junction endodeoxyribonuclease RusA
VIIEVLSRPTTQGSKKAFVNHRTGRAVMMEQMGDQLKNWRADVRAAAEPHRGRFVAKEPLRVVAHFTLAKPVSAPKRRRTWPTGMRNDLEKLLRSTYDALTSSGVWADDSQVVQEMSSKSYPGEGDGPSSPGVLLMIYSLLPASDGTL